MLTDCLTCQNIDRCDQHDRWDSGCINYKMMPTKNPTNADRIRNMTDEELAEFLYNAWDNAAWCSDKRCTEDDSCLPCWLKWLREECNE